jgi:hypothetical protein
MPVVKGFCIFIRGGIRMPVRRSLRIFPLSPAASPASHYFRLAAAGLLMLAPLSGSPLAAQTATAPASTETSRALAGDLKITLMDGSVLAGKLSVADLTIDTRFGTLKVPIAQIQSFAPGLKSHPDFEKKIDDLVNDLAADAFTDREKAQQELMKIGPVLKPEVERQLKGAQAEKQMRLQKLVEDFESEREEDADTSMDWTRDDVIVTPGFTIVGHISTSQFAVQSNYGTLQVKLSDVRMARRDSAEPEEIHKTFAVSGNVMNNHSFFAPGVRLARGDQVTITAGGTVTMSPWGNNAQSGPDGARNYGVMQPGNIPTGTLIGRVGGGEPFKVGSKFSFTATKPGPIDFSIAIPGEYSGNSFPGEYEVKIRIVRKQ